MLRRDSFTKIMSGGFGDPTVRIAQAMAWFDGALFVGTGGRSLNPLGLSDAALERLGPLARLAMDQGKKKAPGGAAVWRYTPGDAAWTMVYKAADVEIDGVGVPRDRNVRASLVWRETTGDEALYLGVSAMKGRVRLVCTTDGSTFEEGPVSGLGLPEGSDVPSIRSLVAAEGHVFTSPVGMIEGRGMLDDNMSAFPMVFRAEHPFSDRWEPVSVPGFGDPDNLSVNEIAAMDGWLYAGTLNIRRGAQLWRCPLQEMRPDRWERVFRDGAGLGPQASIVAAMCAFRGGLYVSTGLQRQGRAGMDRYGPIGGELLRVLPDGEWQLVSGQNRLTEDGWKPPLSGLGPSLGEPLARGIWQMAEHEGVLYAAGADWRIFRSYLPPETSRLPPPVIRAINERHDAYGGGFPLWASEDGVAWMLITRDGFEKNPETGGARFLQSSPDGLYVGTSSTGKSKEFGGLQVWFGARDG